MSKHTARIKAALADEPAERQPPAHLLRPCDHCGQLARRIALYAEFSASPEPIAMLCKPCHDQAVDQREAFYRGD